MHHALEAYSVPADAPLPNGMKWIDKRGRIKTPKEGGSKLIYTGPTLYSGPLDVFFTSRVAKLIYIPEKHGGVILRAGKARNFQPVLRGPELRDGINWLAGLNGAWSYMAVVSKRERPKLDLHEQSLLTADSIPIRDATGEYVFKVVSPLLALTESDDYSKQTEAVAHRMLRVAVQEYTLAQIELFRATRSSIGGIFNDELNDLENIGTLVTQFYLSNVQYPKEIEHELAAGAIATAQSDAAGEYVSLANRLNSQGVVDITPAEVFRIMAAIQISGNPGNSLTLLGKTLDDLVGGLGRR